MSNLLQLKNGHKAFGLKVLFDEAAFSINAGEHVGVIGPNGAGKTTLFKAIVGLESFDEGELTLASGCRLGYLAQHDEWNEGETVEDYLSRDTLLPIWELKSLAEGLGLELSHFAKPVKSLSGGYRMRVKLLHLLGQQPDLMLLDEPTNYLDLESVLVLETFLQNYEGAFLLISHDREFLRKTTDHILEVEGGEITKYNGNLDDYFEQKQMLREQVLAQVRNQQEKRKAILDFVNRFGAKATKARQAQSRLKQLDKMEVIEVKNLPITAKIIIPEPSHTPKVLLSYNQVTLGYGERIILKHVNFAVERGFHVGVVGVNGAGKSTLLKSMAERLLPQQGELVRAPEATLGYYAQHVAEELNPDHTVLQAMGSMAHPSVTQQMVLNLAGSLLFMGDDVEKKVRVLSGGEKSRVALGRILLQRSPFLVLDEPTNHLDFETVEALVESLQEYKGTVVIVSHDRAFIRRVARRIVEVKEGSVSVYPGTYDEYVWSQKQGALSRLETTQADAAKNKMKNPESPSATAGTSEPKFNFKEERKNIDRERSKLQKEIEKLDRDMAKWNQQIEQLNHNISNQSGSNQLSTWINELSQTQILMNEAEEKWLDCGEKLSALDSQLANLLSSQ